jgi:hydroxyacylglutathione hydrolase
MALVFERMQSEGIAELSYMLGDDGEGVAAVFDPTPNVDKYLELARRKKVAITHIFETHIHADLMSGSRELLSREKPAKLYLSREGGATYGFEHEALSDRDTFTFGKTLVTARHTPGHTPEHVSYLLAEQKHPDHPWRVLTGDSLFVSSAGRPDLLDTEEAEKLTRQLFDMLRGFYLKLPDSVAIYPAHGHGSRAIPPWKTS